MSKATARIGDVPLRVASLESAVDQVLYLANSRNRVSVHLVNSYTVALAAKDPDYRSILKSDLAVNFPDGKPLAIVSRFLGEELEQVRGPSLFELTMQRSQKTNIGHFLLGASEATLSKLEASLFSRYPDVKIVGSYSPPFRPMTHSEVEAQDAAILDSGAHVVWVGLGTPKQDYEAQRLAEKGFLAVAVGAAFDFSAGTKPIAPPWMQTAGLEWLHRLASEPRRLWYRYLWGNTSFAKIVVEQVLSR